MSDTRRRFLFEHAPVRGELVQLSATWQAVLERHRYPPILQKLLGELLAATALLSATIKFNGSLIVQLQGNGPLRLAVVEHTSENTLRATAKWEGEIHDAPLRVLLGDGRFVITIVPTEGKQSYQGIVELHGNSLAEILEHYMRSSEQLATRLWLACDEHSAGGLLLQKLPDASPDEDAWERAQVLAATVKPDELLHLPAQRLLRRLYASEDIRLFEAKALSFGCSCSRERVTTMLRTLGYAEVKAILKEQGGVRVHCEFCNRAYEFDAADAEQVFAAEVVTPATDTRH